MSMTRYTFTGRLVLTGALHIGSGGGGTVGGHESLTDATIIRDSRGQPYIPGSSLRGVIRTLIGQIGPLVFGDVSIIRDDDAIQSAVEQQLPATPLPEDRLQQILEQELSPAERLFGTVYWASPLCIPDLHLHGEQSVDGEIRHGVGIDRDTGAAREAIKYDFEVLPRGWAFAFWMRCDVPKRCTRPDTPDWYAQTWPRMLALALRVMQQGELTLGGRAARGVGQVQLQDVQIATLPMGNRQQLIKALCAAPDSPERYGTPVPDVEAWMQARLQEDSDVSPATE